MRSVRAAFAGAVLLISLAPAALSAQPPVNDGRASLANFLPPPSPPPLPPPPPPPQQTQQQGNDQTGQPRRRPWRDLLDALLEMTAPRLLIADEMTDDPLTTGFGNDDLVEPGPSSPPATPALPIWQH